jgi:transposase
VGVLGGGSEEVIACWRRCRRRFGLLRRGPTGFAPYRAAEAAGVSLDVVAPSKTPRAPGDRIKTNGMDAELLARLLLARQLKPVVAGRRA